MDTSIPQDLAELIWNSIDRLETLEMLLLLQAEPRRAWTLAELTYELRSSRASVEKTIKQLMTHGLVAADHARYRFRPDTPELEAKVVRLAACYRERRVAVIQTIFSRPER
jgi:DNA-binding IclR family transcriptional regulator